MCGLFPLILDSHKAFIQFPKTNNDLLILPPSISLIPLLPVILARSLPAKSIKLNFPNLISLLLMLLTVKFSLTILFSFSL